MCETISTRFRHMALITLFVGGIAIITHITAVAYPEWDGIDIHWEAKGKSEQIQAYGSIWDFTVTKDSTNKFFYNSSAHHLMDTGKLRVLKYECTILFN